MNRITANQSQKLRRHIGPVNVGAAERIVSSLAGGLIAYLGLTRGGRLTGLLSSAAGGTLLYRGVTGHCPAFARLGLNTAQRDTHQSIIIEKSLTVYKPREEVYAYWRDLENLPKFMNHLAAVTVIDKKQSHWAARIPGTEDTIEWKAEILDDRPNEKISWRSIPESDMYNAGRVYFQDAPHGQGTEIHVTIAYQPPAGDVGNNAARLLNPGLSQMIKEDLRDFKSLMEAGEVAALEGQPAAR